jgi:hypothetical protein
LDHKLISTAFSLICEDSDVSLCVACIKDLSQKVKDMATIHFLVDILKGNIHVFLGTFIFLAYATRYGF